MSALLGGGASRSATQKKSTKIASALSLARRRATAPAAAPYDAESAAPPRLPAPPIVARILCAAALLLGTGVLTCRRRLGASSKSESESASLLPLLPASWAPRSYSASSRRPASSTRRTMASGEGVSAWPALEHARPAL